MRTFTLFFLTFILVACDSPSTRRGSSSTTSTSNTSPTLAADGVSSTFGSTNTSSTASSASNTGYESCNLNPQYYVGSIGYFGLCKSTKTTNEVRVYFQSAYGGDQTCLVPTYTDTNGSSTYIGTAQCAAHSSGATLTGVLEINRSAYTGYKMNSVLFIKQSLLSAYYLCMDSAAVYTSSCMSPYTTCSQQATKCANLSAVNSNYNTNSVYNSYISNCSGATTSCSTQGTACLTTLCTQFKSSFNSKYLNISL